MHPKTKAGKPERVAQQEKSRAMMPKEVANGKRPAARADTLARLRSIPKPFLVNGGSLKYRYNNTILNSAGVTKVCCTAYTPLHGPIRITKHRLQELRCWAKGKNNQAIEGSGGQESRQVQLERLILLNNCEADKDYWAFQPMDNAPLSMWIVSDKRSKVEQEFMAQSLAEWKCESWDNMDDVHLKRWARELPMEKPRNNQ